MTLHGIQLQNVALKLIALLIYVLLNACSGEGTTPIQEEPTVALIPSVTFHGDNASYSPAQVVFIESPTPFLEGEVVLATDNSGQSIEIIGQIDGTGMFIIPIDIGAGEYRLEMEHEEVVATLSLLVERVSFPIDSELYVSNHLDELIYQISGILNAYGLNTDDSITVLLNKLQGIRDNFDSQHAIEVDRLAKVLYINAHSLFSSSYSISSQSQCSASKDIMLDAAIPLTSLIGVSSVTTDTFSKVILLGSSFITAHPFIDSTENVVSSCLGNVIDHNVAINSLDQMQSIHPNNLQGLPKHHLTSDSNINYTKSVTTEEAASFYDGDTKSVSINVTTTPEESVLTVINKIKSLLNSKSTLVPDSILVRINNLGRPIEKDITNEVTLGRVNTTNVNCEGTTTGYTCSFPNGDNMYNSIVDFQLSITHPEFEQAITSAARLLPRDLPVIEDQTFSVILGWNKVNRVIIEVVEDKSSPNYELTKVVGYELVSEPEYGFVMKAFNEFGAFSYRISEAGYIPESETFEVRVWNKYGWSNTATITVQIDPPYGFTKISFTGAELPFSATEWSCVRDDDTGLIWEKKTDGDGIHSRNSRYRWGGVGAGSSFRADRYNDWDILVNGANGEALCGFNDWRVAYTGELHSLAYDYTRGTAVRNTAVTVYLPNLISRYWVVDGITSKPNMAPYVDLNTTEEVYQQIEPTTELMVRLVRGTRRTFTF